MPLLRAVGRTAVIAGTASAVGGRVQHKQQGKWAEQEQQQAAAQQAAPAAAEPESDPMEQLAKLGELHSSGVLTDEEFAVAQAKILNA
jgi:membrane protease subunit (stomatin/prohibitin family)